MTPPKLSIIIPLYNREKLIKETINSLLLQTSGDFECLIIDDHSTDSSFEVAKEYSRNDKRFVIRKRTGSIKGAPACRNEGINMATGDYIMFLDSDDLLDPICIEQRLKFINEHAEKDFYVFPVVYFSDQTYIADHLLHSNIHNDNDLETFLTYTGGWQTSSTIFRRDFLKRNHYFDEEALSWQDVEFHLRALTKTSNYAKFFSATPDVYIRVSDEPRITNSSWSYNKIASRIALYFKIEEAIKMEDYQRIFFFYHFKYLEIGARMLKANEYKALKNLWKSQTKRKNFSSFLMLKYLDFQNFLSRNRMYFVGSILYRIIRTVPAINPDLPDKALPLPEKIDLKKRMPLHMVKED